MIISDVMSNATMRTRAVQRYCTSNRNTKDEFRTAAVFAMVAKEIQPT
jgi:hypothetical protein